MAILPALQIAGIVWKVLKVVINEPIVNRALDNWVAGTSNHFDDLIWALVEKYAGATHDTSEEVKAEVERVQKVYDTIKEASPLLLSRMCEPVNTWNMADVKVATGIGVA